MFWYTVETPLGVLGSVECAGRVYCTTVGHLSREGAVAELQRTFPNAVAGNNSPLMDALERYTQGDREPFVEVALAHEDLPPFARAVLTACRQIAYGTTISYAELAQRAGNPRAARAVGNVMATNRWPIVVPCHRVVRADGSLGGYSAALGIRYKQSLLDLENKPFLDPANPSFSSGARP